MFRHAGKSGAKAFDGVKVSGLVFEPYASEAWTEQEDLPNPGRPTSATWSRKEDGSSGVIDFEYLVDATGRAGISEYTYTCWFSAKLK
jgi:hypothetical protein